MIDAALGSVAIRSSNKHRSRVLAASKSFTCIAILFGVLLMAANASAKTYFSNYPATISEGWCKGSGSSCTSYLRQKPKEIKLYSSCGFNGLKWHRWGRSSAWAQGTYACSDLGDPGPGWFRVSRPVQCKGRRIYTRFKYAFGTYSDAAAKHEKASRLQLGSLGC